MPQIIGEYFNQVAGVDIVSIPYRGGEQVRVDILGGRIHMNVGPPTSLMAADQGGQAAAARRHRRQARIQELPDVPTMIESGYPQVGFHPDVWQAIFAPAGTPAAIVEKLNAEINAVLKTPEVQASLCAARRRRHHDHVGAGVRRLRRRARPRNGRRSSRRSASRRSSGEADSHASMFRGRALAHRRWLARCAPAQAQQYPDRVIKLVVPFVPGSPVDVLARVIVAADDDAARPERGDREPSRRRHLHRDQAGAVVAARRLHAADDGPERWSMSACSIPTSVSIR